MLIFQAGLNINLFFPLKVTFFKKNKSQNSTTLIIRTQINKLIHEILMWKVDITWKITFSPKWLRKNNIHSYTPTVQLVLYQNSFALWKSIECYPFHCSRRNCKKHFITNKSLCRVVNFGVVVSKISASECHRYQFSSVIKYTT